MKKTILMLIIICFSTLQYLSAQNNKIYISRQGGEQCIYRFGKICYNNYYFSNRSDECDTLICSGTGYEICKIDRDIIRDDKINAQSFKAYNKAIRKTERYIRKHEVSSGKLSLKANNKNVLVTFYNANKLGEADIEIQIK